MAISTSGWAASAAVQVCLGVGQYSANARVEGLTCALKRHVLTRSGTCRRLGHALAAD